MTTTELCKEINHKLKELQYNGVFKAEVAEQGNERWIKFRFLFFEDWILVAPDAVKEKGISEFISKMHDYNKSRISQFLEENLPYFKGLDEASLLKEGIESGKDISEEISDWANANCYLADLFKG